MRNKITDELIYKYFYGTHYISRAKLKNIPDNIKQYIKITDTQIVFHIMKMTLMKTTKKMLIN